MMSMLGIDGAELLRYLAKDYPSMRRIILTGYSDLDQTLKSINEGRVHRYLTKPFMIETLLKEVRDELRFGERERAVVTRLREAIDRLSDD
jgi:response regulator RpfG family c-di-GMP phosphodiesterase